MILEDVYVEDIVKGLAKKMNALFHEQDNITKFNIPDEKGEGFFEANQFASGIGIIEGNYSLKQDLTIHMEKDKINPLKFVFNLGSTFYHKFDKQKEFKEIKKYESVIIGGSKNDMHSFKIPGKQEIKVFSLELNRNLFEHKTSKFNLKDDLKVLFKDVNALNPFFYSYNFGSEEFEMIKKITKTEKTGFVGSLYKEGLTYSLLSDSLETYLGRDYDKQKRELTEKEIDIVHKVSDFIHENLANLPTIDEIASKVFVSEAKMQKLFKSYYNCSVHDFIRDKRLSKARVLIEKTELTISEIANDLGIRSNSYFSKIFKERYSVTPSKYRSSRLSKIRFY